MTLYNQYNGKYDFVFVGNTMNLGENNVTPGCTDLLLTSSSATLSLNPNQVMTSAYLYWAGSGTGDFNVALNGNPIVAERTFSVINANSLLPYFSAFADVTNLVASTGNGSYTLSDLDISQNLLDNPGYCNNRTNFAGWAMVIVYNDPNSPINQLNIYDGLQGIPPALSITLSNLNVINTAGAEIGFVAWEGDSNLSITETLSVNGSVLSNPPLNPANNAFNGTNSFTGSNTMYNMDLDVYNIQNNLTVGNSNAIIQMTSGQDVILMNVVVTKLNSQLPDATINIDNITQECDSRTLVVDYTVSNTNGTNPLPIGTKIAMYADGQLVGQALTAIAIPVNGFEVKQITLTIPSTISNPFTLLFVVDDNGVGTGTVTELVENNNTFSDTISLWFSPEFNTLEALRACNEGFTRATFDFSDYYSFVRVNQSDDVVFYETLSNAENEINPILNAANYTAQSTPKEIFIRLENDNCYTITSFFLYSRNCPPTVYNYVSGNNDGINDTFTVKGLRDIFVNFEINLYNRWGRLIWTGNNQTQDWDGYSNKGQRFDNDDSPYSTYYYILNLNDEGYPEPLTGFLYYNK
ncbi:MAG: gliding motility-associated C-terminal domain-containing protein [Bacteroidota bacterium]